jgi:hypothetical protein
MLDSLNNQPIGSYRLRVQNLGQTRFFDQLNFELHLIDPHSNKPSSPIFRGLYNAGRPSIYVPVWIDGEFVESMTEDNKRKTDDQSSVHRLPFSVVEQIAQKLGALIPPGGRFWLAYESFAGEGEMMRETRAGLLANIPLGQRRLAFCSSARIAGSDCAIGIFPRAVARVRASYRETRRSAPTTPSSAPLKAFSS